MQVSRGVVIVIACTGLALSACGSSDGKTPPKARLEGSVLQIMDLGYDEVRILPSAEDIAVLFVRKRPRGVVVDAGSGVNESEDYPFKVTVKLWGNPLFGNVRVNLAELDANNEQRGIFTRNVLNDPRRDFPKARISTLFFNKVPSPGAQIKGDFNVTFENGVEPASGRTVFGTFDAKVVQ